MCFKKFICEEAEHTARESDEIARKKAERRGRFEKIGVGGAV